jgi:Golgi SNAP receptor complex protein 1
MATKENLTAQRSVFGNVSSRLSGMTSRFPLVNSLVQRVQVKKKKDSLILGGVIATCIILLLLYAF